MTWYTFLLFVHVSMAIVWIGGGLMIQFFALRAMKAGPARAAAFATDVEWIANRTLVPSSLLAAVSGILLVVEGPCRSGTTGSSSGSSSSGSRSSPESRSSGRSRAGSGS